MNRPFSYIISLTLALSLFMSSCKDDASSPDFPNQNVEDALSFAIMNYRENSRVSYDGLTSTFNDGDLIGCIIASYKNGNYNYIANSCWEYKESDQFLYLKKLFNPQNKPIDINNDTENSIIRHDQIKGAPYLTLLNKNIEYAFFFYYPYIDEEVMLNTMNKALHFENGSGTIDYSLFDFPNLKYGAPYGQDKEQIYTASIDNAKSQLIEKLNGAMLTKPVGQNNDTGSSSKIAVNSWNQYTIAVMKDQNKDDASNLRLNRSDFMYAKIESARNKPITASTTKFTVPIELTKQMATIEIEFDPNIPEPTNVYIKGGTIKDQWGNASQKRLHTGKEFDFISGTLNNYTVANQYAPTLFEEAVLTKNNLYPSKTSTARKYRIILPPMSSDEFICDLMFTIEGTEKTVHLNDNPRMNHIDGNTYYLIKVTKLPDNSWDVIINDWRPGGSQDLVRPDW